MRWLRAGGIAKAMETAGGGLQVRLMAIESICIGIVGQSWYALDRSIIERLLIRFIDYPWTSLPALWM